MPQISFRKMISYSVRLDSAHIKSFTVLVLALTGTDLNILMMFNQKDLCLKRSFCHIKLPAVAGSQ